MATILTRTPVEPAPAAPDAAALPAPATTLVVSKSLELDEKDDALPEGTRLTLKEQAIALTLMGASVSQVSDRLKVQKRTVRAWLYAARRDGKLGDTEMLDRMRFRTDFLALESIEALLEDESVDAEVRLRAALEHLKGRGKYQHHAAINQKVDGALLTELKVSFETTTPDGTPVDVIEGSVLGAPEQLKAAKDADDIDAEGA